MSLNSAMLDNGTFLNGKEVKEPKLLQDSDEIQIALCVKIAFVGSDATAPLNARPISKAMRPVVRGIRIDKESRRVYIAEQELEPPLSLQRYRLLELLVDANGGLVSRQDIVERVWEGESAYGVSEQAIDAKIDSEVSKIIWRAYSRAKQLLTDNRDKLVAVAKALLERETLDANEFRAVIGLAALPAPAPSQNGMPA
ncbi:winged helix-turn-helix domain-containing protein [Candidatus Roseilinea sp. NK_OTU-006]|jgi:hypothetical protein|uniref:winged helix-turn-helix domain-containing protein n=1 Tax=Candidatus Roseilinea sp. NK_OTU-006 TaxID=2704250 RepID=UPI00145DC651|nr:winged helix-turn-helix domain-containing protein [Candidatus Roseilinea sp. NK_OTU-006]